ncbi:glycine/D-amino acid oxidase-like deaminating enzyme [Scopulibacillus darangshiensis]|uniref:Glycine/D-amino acid oxidase-like deaminating enzyme n=1 Tax=Scopulibacillus darangshiensis TaxID=442528 RepID=A0A4R2P3G5_9BACL|nr:FAD-dependent oxidoreductase [Scopulibacillus darangshiensis]TCP28698.1 glycine/D-amino acid oxidase-like deaminating enzyme [Scopulibacillus darangshiensis]
MAGHADIIIVGGGVMGSSIAYNLLNDSYDGKILVFERDPLYEFSSTPRSAGGIRQLYTTDINIQISRYSLQCYKAFPETMAIDGEPAEIDFKQRGYLFLAKEDMMSHIEDQLVVQHKYGVPSEWLDKEALSKIIPELNVSDLAGGLYCAEDGYLDPYSVMQGYMKKAKQLGARYMHEEVDTILTDRNGIMGICTKKGEVFRAPIVINCAGAWVPNLSERIGAQLPILPLKRQIFQFDVQTPLDKPLPLTIDPSGIYFRHEGAALIAGFSEKVEPGIDFHWDRSYFIENMWPILADRISNFEQIKVNGGWAGLYSHNTKDQNAIIGGYPNINGYYVAAGFSGHGMQQAPAVGKGMSELIRTAKYDTIDLSPLRVGRFQDNDLIIEKAIV